MQVVCRQHRRCRNRRQNVSWKLGTGNAEEHDRNQDPDQQIALQAVIILAGLILAAKSLNTISAGPHYRHDGEYGPGKHAQQEYRDVIPERLRVLIKVGAKALQIMLDEKYADELWHPHLHSYIPRQGNRKKQQEAWP